MTGGKMPEAFEQAIENIGDGAIETIRENFELAAENIKVLQTILQQGEAPTPISIQCRDSIRDIGGFYMDEINSHRGYRGRIYVGVGGGDALDGVVKRLINRRTDDGKEVQLEVDVGYLDDEPQLVYFRLEPMLFGCHIE